MVAILEKMSICFDMDFCSISRLDSDVLNELAIFRRVEGEKCATPDFQANHLLYAAAGESPCLTFSLDDPAADSPCRLEAAAVMRQNDCAALLLCRVVVEQRSWGYITLLKRQSRSFAGTEINLMGMMVKSLELYLAKEAIRNQLDVESAMKKNLFEIAPIPFILFDTNEKVLMMNHRAEELSQVKFSGHEKVSCSKLFYGSDNDERDCPVLDALQEGVMKFHRMEVWGRKFDVYSRPMSKNGRLSGVLVSMLDQTELLQSKNHYRNTSMLFNKVIDTIPCIVTLKDYYNGNKYIIANKFLHEFAGLTSGEIIGRDDREILQLNQNSDWAKEEAEAMRTGRLDALDVLRDKDGKRALFNSSLIRIPREDGGDLLLAIRFDVTEIHRSRIALEDNARELSQINCRLKTYLEQSQILRNCTESLACHVRGREPLSKLLHEIGRYLKADRCAVVHYRNNEYRYHSKWYVSAQTPRIVDLPENIGAFAGILADKELLCVSRFGNVGEKAESCVDQYRHSQQAEELAVCVIYCNNKLWGHLEFHHFERKNYNEMDLRLVRECARVLELILIRHVLLKRLMGKSRALEIALDSAQAAVRAKSMFLATMSHEIRTPLNAVIGFSELLSDHEVTPEEFKDYAGGITSAGKVLLRLINDILDLSKLESDRVNVFAGRCDMALMGQEISTIFRYKVENSPVNFILECSEDLPILQVNEQSIRQIVLNLVGNSIKFTSSGHILLKVDFEAVTPEKGNLTILVEDTGMGMGEEESKLIFDPFVKVSQRRSERYIEGTGLGLPIVKRLVEKMNGEISFVSRLNEGTTFKVVIHDLSYEKKIKLLSTWESSADALQDFSRLKVMVVDDVPVNLRILGGYLKKLRIEFVLFNSGSEAVAYLQHNVVDAVLTDVWMPGMNGAELALQLHTIDGLEHLPVVAVSTDIELKNNFDTSNFAAILAKPIALENLKKLFGELFTEKKFNK